MKTFGASSPQFQNATIRTDWASHEVAVTSHKESAVCARKSPYRGQGGVLEREFGRVAEEECQTPLVQTPLSSVLS